jgi:hypothetical protein
VTYPRTGSATAKLMAEVLGARARPAVDFAHGPRLDGEGWTMQRRACTPLEGGGSQLLDAHQPREHEVVCSECGNDTWEFHAVCRECGVAVCGRCAPEGAEEARRQ